LTEQCVRGVEGHGLLTYVLAAAQVKTFLVTLAA
jgi:hypothetical protein